MLKPKNTKTGKTRKNRKFCYSEKSLLFSEKESLFESSGILVIHMFPVGHMHVLVVDLNELGFASLEDTTVI